MISPFAIMTDEACNQFLDLQALYRGRVTTVGSKRTGLSIFYSRDLIAFHTHNTTVPCWIRSCTKTILPKTKARDLYLKAQHLVWIRGQVGEGKSHTTGLSLTLVTYLHFTASLGHRQKPNPRHPSADLAL